MRNDRLPVGFSTGWLHQNGIAGTLTEQMDLLEEAGATAIEIMVEWWPDLAQLIAAEPAHRRFEYVSFHLGPFTNPARSAPAALAELRQAIEHHDARIAVVHPHVVPEHVYALLKENDIPVAVENLDREKPTAKTPADVLRLVQTHDVPAVLDLQHAYENGPTTAKDLAAALVARDALAHLHLSGELGGNHHALLTEASNAAVIKQTARDIILTLVQVPIILEGELQPTNVLAQMRLELATVRGFLP